MSGQADLDQFDVQAVNARDRRGPLYAARKKIHPKRAQGRFRQLKWVIMVVTLSIYYVTPWLRWDRGAFAPDQAVLVDLANRRFYFFFIEIWPQEFYYVAGLLVMAGIGLFLVTSTVGRAWCGYACPQTVWVDLFLVVERFFEGDRNARLKLDRAGWSLDKLAKRMAKHITWILIGIATGGAWIFYFADAPTLALDFVSGEAAPVAYITVAVLTATTYVFGGHMREQVCTYMCPWPRIQGAMLDEHSLVVTYNDWRGEPRRPHKARDRVAGASTGDCVDCNACVVVCPMGIDIREGQQLECITCALCIDACDGVMQKLGKERGLISYATLATYNENMALASNAAGAIEPERVRSPETGRLFDTIGIATLRDIIRPRTLIYTGLWALVGLAMLVALLSRGDLEVNVLHDRNPVYVQLSGGWVRNGYTVKILNKQTQPRSVRLTTSGLPGALMTVGGATEAPSDELTIEVEPDRLRSMKIYVRADPRALDGTHSEFSFEIVDLDATGAGARARYEAVFESPGAK